MIGPEHAPRPAGIRRTALFLFLAAGFVYNLNLRGISSGDNVPGALLPFAVLVDRTITFDRYDEWYRAERGGTPYFLTVAHGQVYSRYPIALPLLVTPAYAPIIVGLGVRHWPTEAIYLLALRLEKLAGSAVSALAVVAFFLLAVRLTETPRLALLASVVFGFATPTWSISSQALWQHGGSELAVLLGLLALHWYHQTGNRLAAAGAGACGALAAAIRPTGVLFVVALGVYWLMARPRRIRPILWFSVPLCLIGAAVAGYNLWVFGDLRGGYNQPWNGHFWSGLAGILISPSRGLLVFCPFLLFAAWGLTKWVQQGRPHPAVYLPALIFTVLYLVVIAWWPMWWGGESYGPRLLTDVAPTATLLLLPAWPLITGRPIVTALLAATAVYAASLQAIGAFWFPKGDWANTPAELTQDPSRLWDWRDNQVWRSLRAGPELRPYRKLLEEWFR